MGSLGKKRRRKTTQPVEVRQQEQHEGGEKAESFSKKNFNASAVVRGVGGYDRGRATGVVQRLSGGRAVALERQVHHA